MDKINAYLDNVISLLSSLKDDGSIAACARLFADTLKKGNNIFLFGTGHSHMLAEELFYRAGGLVNVRPILETSLMLHESAAKSTEIERLTGYADILISHYGIKAGDTVVIISNSGRNGVCVDMALKCKENGAAVVALTSVAHSGAAASRHPCGKRLFELADIVLDNRGCPGDACIKTDGLSLRVAPTSTVIGAAILNAVEAQCVEYLVKEGVPPEIYSSSNVDGGDEINERYIEKYRGIIRHL